MDSNRRIRSVALRGRKGKTSLEIRKDDIANVVRGTLGGLPLIVSEPANSIDMPDKSMPGTGKSQSGETAKQLTLLNSPTSTSSVQDFLANLSQLLASDKDSMILEAHSSLRYAESLGLRDLAFYYLRTSKDSSPMMKGIPSKPSSERWMNWGMTVNGKLLTAKVSESHRTGSECSLSDILEEHPDSKYFLSEKMQKGLMKGQMKPQVLEPFKGEDIQEDIIQE